MRSEYVLAFFFMFGTSIFLISLFNTGAIISFDKEIALSLKDNVPKTGSSQFLSIGIPSYPGCQDIPIDHSNKFLFIDVSNKTGVISKSSIFQDGDIRATKDDSKFTVILIVERILNTLENTTAEFPRMM